MDEENRISIWFFVGSLLTVYGIIIVIAGLPALLSPSIHTHVVLSKLHAGVWWGCVLFIIGLVYVYNFWPGKNKKKDDQSEE